MTAFDLLVYLIEAIVIGKVAAWCHFTGSSTETIIHTNSVLVLVMVNVSHVLRIYRISNALLILHIVIPPHVVVLTLRLSPIAE